MSQQQEEIKAALHLVDQYFDRHEGDYKDIAAMEKKSLNYFVTSMGANLKEGFSDSEVHDSQQKYGTNEHKKKKPKSFCRMLFDALKDEMLIILMVAAVLSLIVDFFYGENKSLFWVQGGSILFAVAVVSLVATFNDFQKQKQFQKLNQAQENSIYFDIKRNGKWVSLHRDEIVVGDVTKIAGGMEVPADGVIFKADNVIADQSAMTGEVHEMYKNVYQVCNRLKSKAECPSPVIISGSEIKSGEGEMLVLLIGSNSRVGKLNDNIQGNQQDQEDSNTPLEQKLQKLASQISYMGLYSAVAVFAILILRLLISDIFPNGFHFDKHLGEILRFLIVSIAIVVVAIPEGLPLAVTLSLAYSVMQLLQEQNLVKKLASCETMGGAHFICTDKTGTLTMNKMNVVEIWNGTKNSGDKIYKLTGSYKSLILNAIAHNSSAVMEPEEKGSATELALLKYARKVDSTFDEVTYRDTETNELRLPFNSDRKRITTGLQLTVEGLGRKKMIFMSGASEIILDCCQNLYGPTGSSPLDKAQVRKQIQAMAKKGLRTIAMAYKEISSFEQSLESIRSSLRDSVVPGIERIERSGFNLLMIAAIRDLPRPQVKKALQDCHRAGVKVIMVTGDNKITADSIARDIGIIEPENNSSKSSIEGKELVNYLERQKDQDIRREWLLNLRVVARSRPEDKLKLVTALRELDYVVAVTGDGTNDAPALIKADVGFAMGIAGTQIAKRASDIVIMDDNFSSIVRALIWGRNIYDSIRKFLQFQLTVNIVACLLSIISVALIRQPILTTVQMLWVNLIMDSLASLALATEPPNDEQLLSRNPIPKSEGLLTRRMIKHIVGQCIYQMIILLLLLFLGQHIIPEQVDEFDSVIGFDLQAKYQDGVVGGTVVNGCFYDLGGDPKYEPTFHKYGVYSRHFTFIFNSFVMLQAFNFFNCRKIHDEHNIFEGVLKNKLYIAVVAGIFVVQFLVVYFLNIFFKLYSYHGLTALQWLLCIGIGASCLLVSQLIRLLPFGKKNQFMDDPLVLQQQSAEK